MKKGTLTATTDQGTRLNYTIWDDGTVSLCLVGEPHQMGIHNYPFSQVRQIANGRSPMWVELASLVDNYVSVITVDTN